jgi:hypothetical protein
MLGAGTVPTTGVSAVAINVTVSQPGSAGYVTVWPGAVTQRPTAASLNFAPGQQIANLVVAQVGTNGSVQFYNGSTAALRLYVDAAGYFRSGSPVNPGALHALPPNRAVSGVTVAGHGELVLNPLGHGGVPSSGVSAVVINVSVVQPSAAGYVTTYPGGQSRPAVSSLSFAKGQQIANLVVAPVGSDGTVHFFNGSTGSLRLYGDVSGYFVDGAPVDSGAFGALAPARVLNTTTGLGGTTVPAHGTIALHVAGAGGVPTSGVSAAVINVMVYQPAAAGYVTVYQGSARPAVSNLSFVRGQQIANLVVAPVSSGGVVNLYNGSAGTVQLFGDVSGYLLSADVTAPSGTVSHYVNALSALSAVSGCNDAKTAPKVVLLDIGAQTITAPRSSGDPGVALVFSNPTDRPSYGQLVAAINTYIGGFTGAGCQVAGVPTTIALGTNNDGAFQPTAPYSPAQRGADWANDVVDAVAPHPGVTVVGANDIEAGFASSETQAEQWVTAYLANTTAQLIYNGSLDNCPTTFNSTADCGAVKDDNAPAILKTWTRGDYVKLTYSLGLPGRIAVLPQIYNAAQAMQWTNLDVTAGHHLAFDGSLTEFGDCGAGCSLSPEQGWTALRDALAAIGVTPGATATDLRIG